MWLTAWLQKGSGCRMSTVSGPGFIFWSPNYMLAETQKVAWQCNKILWEKRRLFAAALMCDMVMVGDCSLFSLSCIKRDASRFGDVKQICFVEAINLERIPPFIRCWGLELPSFPSSLQIPAASSCKSHVSQAMQRERKVQSQHDEAVSSPGTEGFGRVSASSPMSTKISYMLQRNAAHMSLHKAY